MLTVFISAFLLGLIFNAAPGAVFAETVRQGVRGGFRPALAVQIGSLVGDALWAVLGLVGIGLLLQLEALRLPIGIAGALYLLWLAYDSWRAASQEFRIDDGTRSKRALRAGVLLSVTNPQNVAYWAALGSALGAVGIQEPTAIDYGTFFGGFMASSIVWSFVCAAIVDRLFRKAGARWASITYKVCAVAFVALAAGSVRDLIHHATKPERPDAAGVLAPPPP
ncbi:chemosensory pili system protein ChpE/L-lysine exporter family protein LysE/ArgO [Povalibacter uvarum]|uniref:Chemosensory pili system protein ChpE/L-lysine exporter family protein LysE/ArgO n=1 Tax=Povalibacter uvarum TaxID=732238 RepID=A0A841HR58_9GAMM|nr:LysE family transporter [Povalibacter uvarum]MBB6095376.1 chemosensory pili system protein ChpE/L-lysine exporter family protein LysE/ArgO [Povalibacter uvarum]